jgi:hypothetical protein
MSVARLLLPAALTIGLACHSAKAELIDHLSVEATPSTYEGPCPVTIKLQSIIKFEVSFNTQEKFVYRWEAKDKTLTEEVVALSKGRTNHVETTIDIQAPVGRKITLPIRLHVSWGTEFNKETPYLSLAVNDHYSEPTNVTVTCR